MEKMTRILGLVLGLALLVTGCGYTTGSVISAKYQTIFVEPVANTIDFMNQDERALYVPQLEQKVHAALIDRFMFDGNLRVAEQGDSDLVLKAKLTGFAREELRLTQSEDVKEYRIRITVALEMWDPVDEKMLWKEPTFSGETTYYTSGALAKSEADALTDALTDLSRRIVERTIEDW